MKHKPGWTLVFLLMIGGILGYGQGQKPLPDAECRTILKQMSGRLLTNSSLKARFVQERHLVLFDDVVRVQGFCYYQAPGRMRWEFVEPYASIVVMLETGRVEKFDIIDGRPTRAQTENVQVLTEVLERISRWMHGDIEPVLKDFAFSLYPGPNFRLVLRPASKNLAALLSRIEFEIDSRTDLVQTITLWENEQNFTVIRFLEQSTNGPLPDRLFDVKNPKIFGPGER
jgi:outer membrane lipoprotein-sorting protein